MIHDDSPTEGMTKSMTKGMNGRRDPFGRIASSDGSQERLKAIADLSNIVSTIGEDGENAPEDVARVEMMLEATGDMDLRPSEGPTGYFGQRLLEAISQFQKRMGLTPTGFVRPGDSTHRALVAKSADRNGRPDASFDGEPGTGMYAPIGPSEY
nr:hypothetical protein 3 [bacterium]